MRYSGFIAHLTLAILCFNFSPCKATEIPETAHVNDLLAFALAEISRTDQEKDTALAIQSFETAAERGSSIALHALGLIHLEGIGVQKSKERAYEFFSQGAKKKYPPSQNMLGALYMQGIPNPNRKFYNYKKAGQLFEQAAAKNYGPAQYNLGNAFRTGRGKPKDLKASHDWFQRAAEQEVAEAQYFLAVSYELGAVKDRDLNLAKHWFCKAASQELVQAEVIIRKRYGGMRSCPSQRVNYAESSILMSQLRDREQETRRNRASQTRTILSKIAPSEQETVGEGLLGNFFEGFGTFLLEMFVEVAVAVATEVIVYKVLDLESRPGSYNYYSPSYSSKKKVVQKNQRYRPIYGVGSSIANGTCECQCVNGRIRALCSNPYKVKPICTGVCPSVDGSVRPPAFSGPRPPGTSICQNEQVYDWVQNRYIYKRLCR